MLVFFPFLQSSLLQRLLVISPYEIVFVLVNVQGLIIDPLHVLVQFPGLRRLNIKVSETKAVIDSAIQYFPQGIRLRVHPLRLHPRVELEIVPGGQFKTVLSCDTWFKPESHPAYKVYPRVVGLAAILVKKLGYGVRPERYLAMLTRNNFIAVLVNNAIKSFPAFDNFISEVLL